MGATFKKDPDGESVFSNVAEMMFPACVQHPVKPLKSTNSCQRAFLVLLPDPTHLLLKSESLILAKY